MNVAIILPTLGRPQLLEPLVANLRQTTPLGYRVYFVTDDDDAPTHEAIAAIQPERDVEEIRCDGNYATKVNAAVAATDEEIVLLTGDDVIFHSGWFEAVQRRVAEGFHVVGTRDLTPSTAKENHSTSPLIRRSYIEDPGGAFGEPGVTMHEGYIHNFAETELWQLAAHRGVAVFEGEAVIEHCHPAWGTREADETDRVGNAQGWDRDKALFNERKAQWTSQS